MPDQRETRALARMEAANVIRQETIEAQQEMNVAAEYGKQCMDARLSDKTIDCSDRCRAMFSPTKEPNSQSNHCQLEVLVIATERLSTILSKD